MPESESGDANIDRKKMSGHVLDLDQKLDYLIHERGDCRKKIRVSSQETLAVELDIHPGNISKWRAESRVPKLSFVAPVISEIFDCDGGSFRLDDFETFKRKCEANEITWGRLVHGAQIKPDAVKPVAWQPRNAGLQSDALILQEDLPLVVPGGAFEVEFNSPERPDGKPEWAGWHVLMFNGDRDGYLNWMPRYRKTAEFRGADRFTASFARIAVPNPGGQQIVTGKRASGEHDVVLVVSRDPVPAELEAALGQEVANAALAPALETLAIWLTKRIAKDQPEAAIVRAPYFVG